MAEKLFETVPSYSEGRDMEEVAKIAACFKNKRNIRPLDCQTDVNHSRRVITAIGEPEAFCDAVVDPFEVAAQLIDIIKHEGQHPCTGAVDVVPFILCCNTTIVEADVIAREVGKTVGEKFGILVFLYEDSTIAPHRANLTKIHKSQFEGMAEKPQDKELWTPDFEPDHTHPIAGVAAIGVRIPFITYSASLDADNMKVTNHIAGVAENTRGGYHLTKAIGVELKDHHSGRDTVTQVSMNLVNYEKIAIYRTFEVVRIGACRYNVNVFENETVGVVPMQSLIDCTEYYLQACMFGPMKFDAKKQIMENWLLEGEEEEV